MLRFIAVRLIVVIAVAITLSFITFFLLNYAIDPAQAVAGEEALFEEIEQVRIQYGFDRPILERYFEWASGVMRGNFGESYYWNKSVYLLVLERAPETITLALMSVSVTIIIAIPLGILAALNPNTIIDRFALGVAVAAQAVPNFWLGLLMIILFALTFPIFPVSGDKTYFHFVILHKSFYSSSNDKFNYLLKFKSTVKKCKNKHFFNNKSILFPFFFLKIFFVFFD